MTRPLPTWTALLIALLPLCLLPAAAADPADADQPPAVAMDALAATGDARQAEPVPGEFAVFTTPEPSRAVLLAVGSLLLLAFYRRAWLNFRQPT